VSSLVQDVRYAFRQILKQPSFAAVVVVTLALAVGVNTLIFSFVNFFVLSPLPFGDVSRTTMLFTRHPERGRERTGVAYADLVDWKRENRSFEDMGALRRVTSNLTGRTEPMRVQGAQASASLFSIWNLHAVRGRLIHADDDRRGAPRVAMLSHGFWTRHFGGDPHIIGQALGFDGIPHLVVGVLTPSIEIGNLSEIDVWTPLSASADPQDRKSRTLRVTARLKPGVELAAAAAEMRALSERLSSEYPETNARWTAEVLPIRRAMTGANTWTVLALMAVAVALVLVIACANVASLMLARGTARQRETAVRAALGASRSRLVRQRLTEGAVLAVLGGALGVVLASAGLDVIRAVTFEQFFQLLSLDRRVLAFSAAISLLTPIVFALIPALSATRRDVVGALKEGALSAGGSPRRTRGRNVLVVGQLALALALLLVAGLSVRMAMFIQRLDLGFEPAGLLTLKTELKAERYASDERVVAFARQLESRLAALPGVRGVAVASARPVLEPEPSEALLVEGAPPPPSEAQP
jgi:putative ABC transport system permease protein